MYQCLVPRILTQAQTYCCSSLLGHRVSILCDPSDYTSFLESYKTNKDVSQTLRNNLALKAFTMTAAYDTAISNYFRKEYASADGVENAAPEDKAEVRYNAKHLTLRYGLNPHQKPAQAYVQTGRLPFTGVLQQLRAKLSLHTASMNLFG